MKKYENAAQSDAGPGPSGCTSLGPRAELTLGEPAQSTDPRIGEAAAAALRQGLTHYPPAAGLKSLRELLAEREKAQRGWRFRPEQILITDGAQEALAVCCLGLLNPGDEVLVTDPGYPGTLSALALASAMPVFFHLTPKDNQNLRQWSARSA